jgi:hypothetical protein
VSVWANMMMATVCGSPLFWFFSQCIKWSKILSWERGGERKCWVFGERQWCEIMSRTVERT